MLDYGIVICCTISRLIVTNHVGVCQKLITINGRALRHLHLGAFSPTGRPTFVVVNTIGHALCARGVRVFADIVTGNGLL